MSVTVQEQVAREMAELIYLDIAGMSPAQKSVFVKALAFRIAENLPPEVFDDFIADLEAMPQQIEWLRDVLPGFRRQQNGGAGK